MFSLIQSTKSELEQTESETESVKIAKKDAEKINHVTAMWDKDDFILVWCCEQPVSDEIAGKLRPLCNDIHYYQDSASCISYIDSLNPKHKVFLIVSPLFTLLENVNGKRSVDTIFIFEREVLPRSNLTDFSQYSKAIIVSFGVNELVDSIIKESTELARHHQLFNLYNHKQKALCNLSENSSSFLWFQLFKSMLIYSPKDPQEDEKERYESKKHMLQQCYRYYRHTSTELKNIAEFEINYTASQAIRWYTRDSFIYKLVNKALRTEDIEVLHTFRFFITDLCANLTEKHKKMFDLQFDLPSVVFRGARMTKEEIDYLKENEGCLIATNGFLSTSRVYNVAKIFAGTGKLIFSTFRFNYFHRIIQPTTTVSISARSNTIETAR